MKEQTVFDRAKALKGIGDLLGVPAHPINHRRLKECPICAGRFTFSFNDTHFKCWRGSCGASGDVIELARILWSCSPLEAALDLAGERKGDEPRREFKARPRPAAPSVDRKRLDTIADLLAGCVPARGTIVEAYLRSRGLSIDAIDPALEHLFFNPRATYFEANDDRAAVRMPAMVARVVRGRTETGGVHCTYLRADGSGKVVRDPAKKMWGPQGDRHGPGGLLLIPPQPGALLCVGEGIENALTAASRRPGAGAFAAGSLDRLQGGMAPDRFGSVDWWKPRVNPDRPAATIRHDGPVLLALDGDMSPLKINEGRRSERTITARQRAEVCGKLAAYWWRAAGATEVRAIHQLGADANDVLREGVA